MHKHSHRRCPFTCHLFTGQLGALSTTAAAAAATTVAKERAVMRCQCIRRRRNNFGNNYTVSPQEKI